MAVIKCKMCGGDLAIEPGSTVAECEYCGSRQTVPTADNEKKLNLFASANKLRAACEFDRAAGVYDAIKAEFPSEAEAYWGLVLCKYGIEYVDDPATGKKIPTCHRLSYDSVMDDANLDLAIDCADAVARKLYREEARQLEKIRTGILEVSSKENPYDIFICYKETDPSGDRTLDSVLAQDIYSALADKGYRVFFSRITLQSHLGEDYEPYIFAALNSARVMLAIGTDPECYSAVWVKNEWSRYLKICATDKSKHLIPCYKDMDAYDMPKEFRSLQGVDLGQMGAVQDILFNMEKYIPLKEQNTTVIHKKVEVGNVGGSNKIASLLDRGNMALEDGDWVKADSFFEDVLNNDSRNVQAYIGKALAREKCRTMDAFVRKRKETNMSIPSETLVLQPDLAHIGEMVQKYSLPGYVEEATIRDLYDFDLSYSSEVSGWEKRYKDEVEYWAVHRQFARAEQFADVDEICQLLEYRMLVYTYIEERKKAAEQADADNCAKLRRAYAEHIAEADKKTEKIYNDGLCRREADYRSWQEKAKTETSPYVLRDLEKHFSALGDYKDSKDLVEHCCKRAAEEQVRVDAENERQKAIAEQEQRAKQKKKRIIAVVSAAAIVLTVATVFAIPTVIIPSQTYKKARALREAGDYMGAVRTFREIPYYKDVKEQLEDFKIVYTKESYVSDSGKYAHDITYEYDAQGNLISKVQIDDDGYENRYTYEYDENGNLLSEVYATPYSGYTTTYRYDENGNVLLEKKEDKSGNKSQCTYQYDENGNLIFEQSIDTDGEKGQVTYQYDENNNLISQQTIDSDGDKRKYTWTYDESGNKLTERYWSSSGYTDYCEYTYDEDGNLLVEKKENYKGEMEVAVRYSYDKHGNLVKEKRGASERADEIQFTYDSQGKLIQRCFIEYGWGNYTDETYTRYAYDEDGNLIKISSGSVVYYTYSDYIAFYCPRENR